MQWDTFLTIMEQIGLWLESAYFWNFGEPFLHSQIFDMLAYAHRLNITSYISTNGIVLYSADSIDALIYSGLDYLIISLDGASPETLGKYRVGVDFDKVVDGISRLQRAKAELSVRKPMISIQFVVMKHNTLGSLKNLTKSKIGKYNHGGNRRMTMWHNALILEDSHDTKTRLPDLQNRA